MNNLKRVSEISMDGDSIKYEQGSVSQNQHATTSQNQNDKMSFINGSNISDSCLYYAANTKTQADRMKEGRMDLIPPTPANSQVPLSLRNIDRTAEQILFNAGSNYADRFNQPSAITSSFSSPSEPPPGFGSNPDRIRPCSPFDISSGISYPDMLRRLSADSVSFRSPPNPLDSPGFERSISYADTVRKLPANSGSERSSPLDFITGRLQAISVSNDSNRSSPADFSGRISYADKVKSPSANSISNRSSPSDCVSNRNSPSDYISRRTDNSHRFRNVSSLTDDSGRFSYGSFNSSSRGSPLWQQELAWQQDQIWKQEAAVEAIEVNKALLSGIDKLTIDTESTATLVNEDHAFIPDNMTHATVNEPFLLQKVTTDNYLVNADTDPNDNYNATAFCKVYNLKINDVAIKSTINDFANDNTTNHSEETQHLINDSSTLYNDYVDDHNDSITESEDEIYYSDEEEFFQDNNNPVAYNADLNNPSRELYLENPTEGSYMKNQYPGSSPRTSCSESVESYYYSAENNESIDVEIDQSLIDNDIETEVHFGAVSETGDVDCQVKEEAEEWKTVDRQRGKRRTSVIPVRENQLKQEYCFWYWKRGPGSKDYGAHCNLICTFETVEEFWAAYSHLTRPDEMRNGLDMHVFKKGIKPVWEDEANRGGGKWMVRLPKHKISLCWENLLLAVLGDQFLAASQYICGVVVSARFRENFIALWVKQTGDPAINNYICDKFKKVLKMSRYESNVFEYKAHQDSLKDDRSFQNTDIFIR